jgi:hypothetical protein
MKFTSMRAFAVGFEGHVLGRTAESLSITRLAFPSGALGAEDDLSLFFSATSEFGDETGFSAGPIPPDR